jgi:hypothetical protein
LSKASEFGLTAQGRWFMDFDDIGRNRECIDGIMHELMGARRDPSKDL